MDSPAIANRSFDAFLFDMDGTLINSTAAAERVWGAWARRHELDVAAFLKTIHGVRGAETIAKLNLPGIDPKAEAAAVLLAEMEDVEGITPIAGAAAFLASLPVDRWGIVTSAPRRLAEHRLKAAGLPLPPMMVSGEEVLHGKPAPDCFLLGAGRLGRPIGKCLVFEDAPAGIEAAETAGASVIVIGAAHATPFATAHPTIGSYDLLCAKHDVDGGIALTFSDNVLN
jgi:sugar-phosphatase